MKTPRFGFYYVQVVNDLAILPWLPPKSVSYNPRCVEDPLCDGSGYNNGDTHEPQNSLLARTYIHRSDI